ncbi:MAG TPA: hypothetical protein VHV29_10040 [Terriglobales bacterium]|jgi:hypothetical protein|nr:hypothetical protein [Terriglobales bacterium]
MDIGTAVSWVQLGIWMVGLVILVTRIVSGKTQVPQWVKTLATSNVLLTGVIISGLTLSAVQLYRQANYQCVNPRDLDASNLDIKSLERIEGKQYSNESVEVDGKYFEDCTFENVTFIIHGKKTAAFYHNNWYVGVKLLTDNASVSSFIEFTLPFRMLGTDVQWGEDQKTHMVWLKRTFSGTWGYSGAPGVPAQIFPAPAQNQKPSDSH